MGFMSAYKNLDSLCRDINSVGVTGYIEDMEHKPDGKIRVSDWENDYRQLKHYRYIRNQIAHETYADEENMTSAEDADWLDNFYNRILNQADPLTIYRKVSQPISPRESAGPSTQSPYTYPIKQNYSTNDRKNKISAAAILGITLSAVLFIALLIVVLRALA